MSSSTSSPATSPRPHVLPQQPSETTQRWTKWDLPNSDVIRDNLKRVLEYKEYRIHGAFTTGITALRAGIEIIPRAGKVLLDTATWFVDTNRPRGEGYTIVTDGLIDVLDCIKVAIALPFFAIAGIFSYYPAEVFGLFENIPGLTSQVEISKQYAELEEFEVQSEIAEIKLDAAEEELDNLLLAIEDTNEELIAAEAQLQELQETIATKAESATAAEKLKAEVLELQNQIGDLTRQEGTQSAILEGIQKDIARLKPALESAQSTHKDDLAKLERDKAEKETELKRIQLELNQAIASQAAAKAQSRELSEALRKLNPEAEDRKAEVATLQQSVKELQARENSLQVQIQQQKDILAKATDDFVRAQELNNATLRGLQTQIAEKESALLESRQRLEQLGREEADLSSKQAELKKQYEQLRDTTLPELLTKRDALQSEADKYTQQKDAIILEIVKEEQALTAKSASLEALENQAGALRSSIQELSLEANTFSEQKIPELKKEAADLQEKKTALSASLQAETARLEDLRAKAEGKSGELEKLGLELASKRAEQESLERTLAEAKAAFAAGEAESNELIIALRTRARELGTKVIDLETNKGKLKRANEQADRDLQRKTEEAQNLVSTAEAAERKNGELKTQTTALGANLSVLQEKIGNLESQKGALLGEKTKLEQQVETLTTSVEETTSQLQRLELQTRDLEKREKEASAELAALQPKLLAAHRENDEIQGAIASVKTRARTPGKRIKRITCRKSRTRGIHPKIAN